MNSNHDSSNQLHSIQQKPTSSFKLLILLALLATVFFIAVIAGTSGQLPGSNNNQPIPSPPPLVQQPTIALPTAEDTVEWKTYSNSTGGFEVKYPPYYDVLTNDPYGKRNPKFVDKRYNSGYERPGLTLDFDPMPAIEMPYFSIQSRLFDIKNREDNAVRIYFTNARGQKLYATCTIDDSDINVLNICNTIISTIRFTL